MTKLLLDMGLPRRAAARLRASSWDVLHVAEAGMASSTDGTILAAAERDGRVVVTLDGDFAALVATGALTAPSVIHLRLDRVTWEVAVTVISDVVAQTEQDLQAGCIVSVTPGGYRVRRLPVR